MKKIILIFILMFFFVGRAGGEEISISTYHPSPIGTYSRLKLGEQDSSGYRRFLNAVFDETTEAHLFYVSNDVTASRGFTDKIIFSHTASSISNDWVMDEDGQIGIGTDSPAGIFNVVGGDDTEDIVAFMPGTDSGSGSTDMKVGIGTDSPSTSLEVSGEDETSVAITNYSDTDSNCPSVSLKRARYAGSSPAATTMDQLLGKVTFQGYDGSAWQDAACIYAEAKDQFASSVEADLYFQNSDGSGLETRMFIDQAGDIGFGTTSPGSDLHIYDDVDNFMGIFIENNSDSSNSSEGLYFINENGQQSGIRTYDDDHASYANQLRIFNNRLDSAGQSNGGIELLAGSAGTLRLGVSGATNAFVIDSTHNVGIGRTPDASYKLDVSGTIRASGGFTESDARLKKNVKTIEDPLVKIQNLRGVEFEWKTDEYPDRGYQEGIQIGLIAQETEEVLPELVLEDDEGYKAVAYANIVALLIEGMKEQEDRIRALEAKIEQMEGKINQKN